MWISLLRVLVAGAVLAAPVLANAQDMATHRNRLVSKPADIYVTPEAGYEVGTISRAAYLGPNALVQSVFFSGAATAVAFGIRLGDANVGLRWQGTIAGSAYNNAFFNKAYAEIGGNIRAPHLISNIYFDIGYVGLAASRVPYLNGIGGKIGITLDYFPLSWLSIGAGASFDAQGFAPPPSSVFTTWVNALGGTFMGRLGFHI
jgi:hypothetical protein